MDEIVNQMRLNEQLKKKQEQIFEEIRTKNVNFNFKRKKLVKSPSKNPKERYSTNCPSKKPNRSTMARKLASLSSRNDTIKEKLQENLVEPLNLCRDFYQKFRNDLNEKVDRYEAQWMTMAEGVIGQFFEDMATSDSLE